jgi:hypothetical protein
MSPTDEQCLQETYRREYRSLLQYCREASPYTSVTDRSVRDAMLRIANEESAALEAFGELLERRRVPLPCLGSYPMNFTDLNFVSVRYFIPRLIVEQKQDLAKLEAEVPVLADGPARAAVQDLAAIHRRHLKELEGL